jgi:hypothetical protein
MAIRESKSHAGDGRFAVECVDLGPEDGGDLGGEKVLDDGELAIG